MAIKKYPSSKVFKAELDRKKLYPAYLFMGEEEGEKDKFIGRILDAIFKNTDERRNSTGRFHIDNDEFMAAADFILSSSMFSSSKVCIMSNMDALKNPKSYQALLEDIIFNKPDGTTIIMTTLKNRPPDFLTQKQLETIMVVQFWRYFDNDIYNYIMTCIRKMGLTIDEKGMNLLIERTGKDIKKIDEALEMIRYSGSGDIITGQTIAGLLHDVSEVSLFDFTDLLFKKDRKAIPLYKKLIDEGIPEGRIFFEITRQFDLLEKYYSFTEAGMAVDEAVEKCGINQKSREKFMASTRAFPGESLKKLYPLIARTDYRRKSSSSYGDITATPTFILVADIVTAQR